MVTTQGQCLKQGALDGCTILRFAHSFKTGGGVERHLSDLNRQLSQRSTFTTVQIHLTADSIAGGEQDERIGESRLVSVPMSVEPTGSLASTSAAPRDAAGFQERILDRLVATPTLNRIFASGLLRWRQVPRRKNEPLGAGRKAAEIIRRFRVNLVVLHTSGGADVSEVLAAAHEARVPAVLVHHFSNWRLGNISVRQQACRMEAFGGASSVGVPAYLKSHFHNLSDAVDLQFYRRENARALERPPLSPIIFAPGRVTPKKGQLDVVEVGALMAKRGLRPTFVFAGRVDSPSFDRELRDAASRAGIAAHFAGELSLELYRDWFAASKIMLMPTYHDEGMPRTLIDSQAMQVPPIVYNVGGTSEGLLNGKTGFLIRKGDICGMADAAERLLREADLHAGMAADGRRFVEAQFSLDAFAARHERFYLEAMRSAPR